MCNGNPDGGARWIFWHIVLFSWDPLWLLCISTNKGKNPVIGTGRIIGYSDYTVLLFLSHFLTLSQSL